MQYQGGVQGYLFNALSVRNFMFRQRFPGFTGLSAPRSAAGTEQGKVHDIAGVISTGRVVWGPSPLTTIKARRRSHSSASVSARNTF